MVRREWYLRKRSLLRVEGKLALASICDDLFAWSSLLERYPALRHLLQILNKFLSAQRPAGMRALADDSQPRFCLACSEVFPPSCMSPLLAPRLQRQRMVLFFRGAVTGCAGPRPQLCLQYQTGSHGIEFGVAQGLPEMRLVQRAGVVSSLSHVAVRLVNGVPVGSVTPVGLLQGLC